MRRRKTAAPSAPLLDLSNDTQDTGYNVRNSVDLDEDTIRPPSGQMPRLTSEALLPTRTPPIPLNNQTPGASKDTHETSYAHDVGHMDGDIISPSTEASVLNSESFVPTGVPPSTPKNQLLGASKGAYEKSAHDEIRPLDGRGTSSLSDIISNKRASLIQPPPSPWLAQDAKETIPETQPLSRSIEKPVDCSGGNSEDEKTFAWLSQTMFVKVEALSGLINQVTTLQTPNTYWIFASNGNDSDHRHMTQLRMQVEEKSSCWQRQLLGNWRSLTWDFCEYTWHDVEARAKHGSRSSWRRHPKNLSCELPSRLDPYKPFTMKEVCHSTKRKKKFLDRRHHMALGGDESDLVDMGTVERSREEGQYQFLYLVTDKNTRRGVDFVFRVKRGKGFCDTFPAKCRAISSYCCRCERQSSPCFTIEAMDKHGANAGCVGKLEKNTNCFWLHFVSPRLSLRQKKLLLMAAFYVDFMTFASGNSTDHNHSSPRQKAE